MILSTDSSKEFPWIEVIYSCRNLWLFFVQIKTKVRTQFRVENFEGSVTWKTANMDGWMVVTGCVEGIILKKLTAVVQNGVRPVSFCSGAELSEGNHHRFNAHEGSCTVFIFRNFVLRNCILFLVVTVGSYTEDGVGGFSETLEIICKITLCYDFNMEGNSLNFYRC